MNIYYLDEPLDENELEFVKKYISSKEGIKELQGLKQVRVPTVLPSTPSLIESDDDLDKQIEQLLGSLKKAGLEKDTHKQVVWVMPKVTHWGLKFQMAIEKITGFMPYVAQRWYHEEEELVRGDIRIIDGHGMMYGQ